MATKHLLKFKSEADYKTAKKNHLEIITTTTHLI